MGNFGVQKHSSADRERTENGGQTRKFFYCNFSLLGSETHPKKISARLKKKKLLSYSNRCPSGFRTYNKKIFSITRPLNNNPLKFWLLKIIFTFVNKIFLLFLYLFIRNDKKVVQIEYNTLFWMFQVKWLGNLIFFEYARSPKKNAWCLFSNSKPCPRQKTNIHDALEPMRHISLSP